ncbi:hypothetical protein RI367_006588 [Sorochytrium milnesiophthora]
MSEQYVKTTSAGWQWRGSLGWLGPSEPVPARVCDPAIGKDCTPNYSGEACTALQQCQDLECSDISSTKPEARQLCTITHCNTNYTACYGTYCQPWVGADWNLDVGVVLTDLPKKLDPHFQDQADQYSRLPMRRPPNSPEAANVTAGLCLLGPAVDPCQDNTNVTAIPLTPDVRSAGSATKTFSMSFCNGVSAWVRTYGPEQTCDGPCLFGSCFRGQCDKLDDHSRQPRFYSAVFVSVFVALVGIVAAATWYRRRAQARHRTAREASRRQAQVRQQQRHNATADAQLHKKPPAYMPTAGDGERTVQSLVPPDYIEMHGLPLQSPPSAAHPAEQDLSDAQP